MHILPARVPVHAATRQALQQTSCNIAFSRRFKKLFAPKVVMPSSINRVQSALLVLIHVPICALDKVHVKEYL
jgi:hypothetical protein